MAWKGHRRLLEPDWRLRHEREPPDECSALASYEAAVSPYLSAFYYAVTERECRRYLPVSG
jgi:hypothetical protein